MISSKNTVLRIIAGKVSEPFSVKIISDEKIKSVAFRVLDSNGAEVYSGTADSENFEGSFL